jgi:uncharacterized protein (TIGR04222 family)
MFWVPFLLLAWVLAGISCIRLCLAASLGAGHPAEVRPDAELSIYEAAFLSGGPDRVAATAMIAMARQRRLLLAHTGWATVVDPDGKDELERSVLGAFGPDGQAQIAPVRHRTAGGDAVRGLAERLTAAGLAVPDGARGGIEAAVRQVQAAAVAIVGLGALSLLMWPDHEGSMGPLVAWFLLPLILTLGCLAIARFEVHPYTRWASTQGQQLLGMLETDRPDDERGFLTAVAVRGPRAVTDPALRAAFGDGR